MKSKKKIWQPMANSSKLCAISGRVSWDMFKLQILLEAQTRVTRHWIRERKSDDLVLCMVIETI